MRVAVNPLIVSFCKHPLKNLSTFACLDCIEEFVAPELHLWHMNFFHSALQDVKHLCFQDSHAVGDAIGRGAQPRETHGARPGE